MKKSLISLSVLLAAAFTGQTVLAQAPKTREEVKKEAAEANKSGAIEKGAGSAEVKGKSTAARADVKKEAAAAEKAGTIEKGAGSPELKGKSTAARADVKSDAAAAVKTGEAQAKDPVGTPADPNKKP
jgi:hypothetical protein